MLGLDVAEHLEPIEPAALQPDIEEHQARPACMDCVERIIAVTRDPRRVALVLEDTRHQLADVSFVVNDQDVGSHSPCSILDFFSSVGGTGSDAKRSRIHAPR